jgi:hypothetical protein
MTRRLLAFTALLFSTQALAHGDGDGHQTATLHEGYEYDNCYIDLHEELGQDDFRQFNDEFTSGFAFTSLSGPETLHRGHVEFRVGYRPLDIDESSSAWNDTWSHPGDDHWLGPVKLPLLQVRVGITDRTDIEGMFSMGGANWAIGGLGMRHALLVQSSEMPVELSIRETVQVTRGGDLWTLVSVGGEALVGRTFALGAPRITATPYVAAGAATGLGIESDDDVDLASTLTFSPRATAGLDVQLGPVLVGVEGTVSEVNQWNLHFGGTF